MQETRVRSLGREDPLGKEMATHSSTLAWRIPWREAPGRLQSMRSQRVEHEWVTSLSLTHWYLEKHGDWIESVAQSCLTLCDPIDCSMPGLPVHHQLTDFTQTHVHLVGDAIQPSHPLLSPSPAFNLSQHQGFFPVSWFFISSAKVLELQLQHQSFQWIFRTDFL